jgi:hypothetical protein
LRILLSFNADDVALAEAFRASLFVASPGLEVFFSPVLFEDYRSLKLEDAEAFVLFVGRHGLSERQARELCAAVEQTERNREFALVPVLAANAEAPRGLLSDLSWIEMPVVTDLGMMRRVIGSLGQNRVLNDESDSGSSVSDRDCFLRQRRLG